MGLLSHVYKQEPQQPCGKSMPLLRAEANWFPSITISTKRSVFEEIFTEVDYSFRWYTSHNELILRAF